jgi:hypothetical protein
VSDLPWTFIAVFFHSFHNTISQWLFPKFFAVADGQMWFRGESGVLSAAGYAVVAAAVDRDAQARAVVVDVRARRETQFEPEPRRG